MSKRTHLWSLLALLFVVYVVNFLIVGIFNTFTITVMIIGLFLFTGWLIWEGKRSGFLKVLLGKEPH